MVLKVASRQLKHCIFTNIITSPPLYLPILLKLLYFHQLTPLKHHKQGTKNKSFWYTCTARIQQYMHANWWSTIIVLMFMGTSLSCPHRKRQSSQRSFSLFFFNVDTQLLHLPLQHKYFKALCKCIPQKNIMMLSHCSLTKLMLFCHKVKRQCWTVYSRKNTLTRGKTMEWSVLVVGVFFFGGGETTTTTPLPLQPYYYYRTTTTIPPPPCHHNHTTTPS